MGGCSGFRTEGGPLRSSRVELQLSPRVPAYGLFPTAADGAGVEKHTRPEPLYFWGYFVGANAIWIVVPVTCIIYCARHVNSAVAATG